jgi:hypothetical protein
LFIHKFDKKLRLSEVGHSYVVGKNVDFLKQKVKTLNENGGFLIQRVGRILLEKRRLIRNDLTKRKIRMDTCRYMLVLHVGSSKKNLYLISHPKNRGSTRQQPFFYRGLNQTVLTSENGLGLISKNDFTV